MRKLTLGTAAVAVVLALLAGCAGGGRGKGPVESFVISAAANPGLPADLVGAINNSVEPKEVFFVVAPGTNVHTLVATLSMNTEATITVISSGSRVVQQNGATPNDFSAPVMYSIEVAGQKEPWHYRVTVRQMETNARLTQIALPAGSRLQPALNPAIHEYRAEVPFASTVVHLEASAQSRFAKTITIEGRETPGPVGRADVDFTSFQEKPVTIDILAEDGATRDRYTITLVRGAPDDNALLGSLDVQGIPLSPGFAPAQLGYQIVVPFETQTVVVRARPQSPVATLALTVAARVGGGRTEIPALSANGDPTSPSGAIVDFSQAGRLPLVVAVTAQSGVVQQYLVDIRRGPPDTNNFLADLSLDLGGVVAPLSPVFAPNQVRYVIVVPFSARQVRVTAHPQSRVASLQLGAGLSGSGRGGLGIQGDPVSQAGALVDLPPGAERFALPLLVTAQDGGALRYMLELRRAPPDHNSALASLTASAGVLTPPFSPQVLFYSLSLPAEAANVSLAAQAAGPGATLTLAGQQGQAPAPGVTYVVGVAPGASTMVGLVVRAEDGSQRQYTVQVARALPPAQPQQQAQVVQPQQPAAVQQPAQAAQPAQTTQPAQAVQRPAQPQQQPAQTAQQPVQQQKPAQPAQQPAQQQQQPVTGAQINPPAVTGTDHVAVQARNLLVGDRELAALLAAKDLPGRVATVTIRPYRSNDILGKDSVAVDMKPQGGKIGLSLQYRTPGVSLGKDRLVEVEVVIPTTAGKFLYYREAMPAAPDVSMDIPFFLYTPSVPIAWPAVGSAVQVAGYATRGGDRPEDHENFQKNGKGEYGISIEIVDAKSGQSYGKDTVWRKPGLGRGWTIAFTAPMGVPEGSVIGYTMTATAANGRTWSAAGQTQVWTTRLRYQGGFEPVVVPFSDELSPGSEKQKKDKDDKKQ